MRQLCKHGVKALLAQKVNGKWRNAVVSKRVAADVRKLAIRSGTYGKFDSNTGIGWDPAWDAPERERMIDLQLQHPNEKSADTLAADNQQFMGRNPGRIHSIRPPKETKRQRGREDRAQKIENLLAQADEKIEEFRLEQASKKPKSGIEEEYKRAASKSTY